MMYAFKFMIFIFIYKNFKELYKFIMLLNINPNLSLHKCLIILNKKMIKISY